MTRVGHTLLYFPNQLLQWKLTLGQSPERTPPSKYRPVGLLPYTWLDEAVDCPRIHGCGATVIEGEQEPVSKVSLDFFVHIIRIANEATLKL